MSKKSAANISFSHYQIVSKLGEGGMGEVYRARDTRLDRDVAIKLLQADVSTDADRLKRFGQEARATSSLNHPNILTVYDIGTQNGSPYIVSELLEGEELRSRLGDGHIPWSKDGKSILYVDADPVTNLYIRLLSLDDRNQSPYFQTALEDTEAKFSPDGRYVAYRSRESGLNEIYVQTPRIW